MWPSDFILSLNDVDGLLDLDDDVDDVAVEMDGIRCSFMLSVVGSISIVGVSLSVDGGIVVMDGTDGFVSVPLALPCCRHLMRSLKDTFRGLATGDKAAVDVCDKFPGVLTVGDVGLKLWVTEGELENDLL